MQGREDLREDKHGKLAKLAYIRVQRSSAFGFFHVHVNLLFVRKPRADLLADGVPKGARPALSRTTASVAATIQR